MAFNTQSTIVAPLLVAGRLVAAEAGEDLINPATGEPLAPTPLAGADLMEEAVRGAREAAAAWGADPDLRSSVLDRIAAVLHEHAAELAQLLSSEIGIPLRDARAEVAMAVGMVRHRAAAGLPVDVLHDDERESVRVVRAPIGVVAAIVPWNAPLLIASEKIASAFAAGDTVVLKPSPLAPLTLLRLGALVSELVPASVLSVVPASDEDAALLTSHPDVGMVSFTGSVATGRLIMAAAAPSLKRLSLELGGNDAAIVLPGSDVERVAGKLFQAAFYRSGQLCAAVKRVYVHEADEERFVQALAHAARSATVGDPLQDDVALGPLSNEAQFERVASLVEDAVAGGGRAVTGGAPLPQPGYFYAPTVVTDVVANTALVAEEQFGPALPVLPYDALDAAVAAANGTEYGLGASVWGDDATQAGEVAAELDAGSVWVNRHGLLAPDVPFGGFKQSGVGRANGVVGVDAYCELKTISVAKPRRRPQEEGTR
jgi:acyl-CoA reductase-like NAD-dependent aldehyde dehydrogenase